MARKMSENIDSIGLLTSANLGAGKTIEKPLKELPSNQQVSICTTNQMSGDQVVFSKYFMPKIIGKSKGKVSLFCPERSVFK